MYILFLSDTATIGKTRASNLDTPTRNRIRGAVGICRAEGPEYTKSDLTKCFKATLIQVDYALRNEDERSRPESSSSARHAGKVIKRDAASRRSRSKATINGSIAAFNSETKQSEK